MPPISSDNRTFKAFRLGIAHSILRNNPHLSVLALDIASHEHIIELCDTYAMRLLLLWMATKGGCDLSSTSIKPDVPNAVSSPERFFLSFEIYPFNQTISLDNHSELVDEANAFLNAAFHPSIELAGSLYEHLTSNQLELVEEKSLDPDPSGQLSNKFVAHIRSSIDGKYGRRKKGQFYTPPWVVDYCLEKSLSQDLAELMKRLQQPKDISRAACCIDDPGVSRAACCIDDPGGPFLILDPACGTGNFLLGIIRNLRTSGATAEQIYTAACESIHGRDIEGRAICIAIWSVALSVWQAAGDAAVSLDFSNLVKRLRTNLRMTDSVFDSFGAKNKNEDRFDLVITNPPYISFGSRNQEKILDSTSLFLRHHFPSSAEYKIRLNSIFQEVALNYVADGGKICLFIPNSFLTGKGYAKLRSNLLNKTRILSFSEFPEETMRGAVVGRWCVAIYQRDDRCAGDLKYPIELVKVAPSTDSMVGSSTPNPVESEICPPARFGVKGSVADSKSSTSLAANGHNLDASHGLIQTEYRIMASRLVTKDQCRFRLVFETIDEELAVKLEALAPLSTVARGHTGIRARAGQKTIIAESKNNSFFKKGIRSGSAVNPFIVEWDGTWLKVDPALLFGGGFDPQVIENPKILMRQTADRIIAAYDDNGLYHLNNVHSFSCQRSESKLGIDLFLLLALMNSTLWHYLYRLKTREDGRALAQIDIETVETMPLPICEARLSERIAELSRLICKDSITEDSNIEGAVSLTGSHLSSRGKNLEANSESDRVKLKTVEDDTVRRKVLENEKRIEIDQLVFQAYSLTPREIEHVERCLGIRYNSSLLKTGAL